jgi:hypothetical protein
MISASFADSCSDLLLHTANAPKQPDLIATERGPTLLYAKRGPSGRQPGPPGAVHRGQAGRCRPWAAGR